MQTLQMRYAWFAETFPDKMTQLVGELVQLSNERDQRRAEGTFLTSSLRNRNSDDLTVRFTTALIYLDVHHRT